MCSRPAIACLLLFASSAIPALGQGRSTARNTFTIGGSVRDDSDQHAMENVRVDLKLSTGIPINSTFTNGNGEFEFGPLGNGDYAIEVNLKDYEPFRQSVTINGGSQRGVSIFLARPVTRGRSNSRTSVSAHELSVPGKARDEYQKGLQLFYGKADYRGAVAQFQRAIKDSPTFYEAYAQMGSAYLELKEVGPAEEAMRKSIELSSGQFSEALFMLAGLLNDTNRYADAISIARKAIDVDPGSWRGPYEEAQALTGLKQLVEAEKSAIQARDLKPDNASVYLMLANIHIQRRDYPALQADLEGYLKLVPSGPQADQARKTRDDIIAARQQAENAPPDKSGEKPSTDSEGTTRAASPAPEARKELPPPAEPDSSGLPSLPPPLRDVQ